MNKVCNPDAAAQTITMSTHAFHEFCTSNKSKLQRGIGDQLTSWLQGSVAGIAMIRKGTSTPVVL